MRIENVKIVQTFLGHEDHGYYVWSIAFENDLIGINTPMKVDNFNKLGEILKLLQCSYENLKKEYCRIKIEDDRLIEIGHLIHDKWIKI